MTIQSIVQATLKATCATFMLSCTVAASGNNPLVSASDFQAEAQRIGNATYVYAPNELMATKLAISYHHQLLETDKDTGVVVMQLSNDDWIKLTESGFRLAPAHDWIAKRRLQLTQLERQFRLAEGHTNNDTIQGFACYSTVEGTFTRVEQLVSDFPQYTRWVDIGDSWTKTARGQSGYDIKVLQITNHATDDDAIEKPILFIHSAMHARELATAELTTRFAEHLLTNHDADADIRWILDAHQVHIVFHMNPDGRKKAESGMFWRKNLNSNYCPSSSSSIGADLNRNFSFFWGNITSGQNLDECSDVYRGPTAGSEPETQAIEQYIRSIYTDNRGTGNSDAAPVDTHGMHIDVHSYGELVLWPWGHSFSSAPNGQALQTLGRKLAKFNGYSPMQSVGLYPTEGTSDEVSYGELGVAAITLELGSSFFESCSTFEQQVLPDNIDALMYAAKAVKAPYLLPNGPEVTEVTINAETSDASLPDIEQGQLVTVVATVNDNYFSVRGGVESVQTVTAASLYVNQLPWDAGANAISLSPTDGIAGEMIEQMQGQFDTANLALGRNTIYVRGQDSTEQWGVVKAMDFNVVEQSEEPENLPPVANFVVECNGLNCALNAALSSDEDGSIASYTWQLGDGSSEVTDEQASLEHRYLPGVYTIELMVTDNQGANGSLMEEITVSNLTPTASFSMSCNEGECQFDGSDSVDNDGSIDSYLWQVDGQDLAGTENSITHTFSGSGSYEVSLTVSDDIGDSNVTTQSLNVTLSAQEPTPTPTPSSSDSAGGGGSMGWWSLLTILLLRLRGKNATH